MNCQNEVFSVQLPLTQTNTNSSRSFTQLTGGEKTTFVFALGEENMTRALNIGDNAHLWRLQNYILLKLTNRYIVARHLGSPINM